jgi:hypothetical protein
MTTTTNFEKFISSHRDTIEPMELDALCLCATSILDCGFCKSEEEERDGKIIHSIICGDMKLELRSEEAKQEFIREIENEFMGGVPYNTWYSVQKDLASRD